MGKNESATICHIFDCREFALVDRTVFLSKFIRSLSGITKPFLAEASDGHIYVVKGESDACISSMLFNEAAGTILYHTIGLATPAWKPIVVTESFVQTMVKAAPEHFGNNGVRPGLAFGSQFLGESGRTLLEILSGTQFIHVRNRRSLWLSWLVDICASHSDNRQIVFLRDEVRRLIATFIDHGHMFGGPEWNRDPHFVACRYLDARIYADISAEELNALISDIARIETDAMWDRFASIPEEWKFPSGIRACANCLNRLQNTTLVRSIADKAFQALELSKRHERVEYLTSDASAAEILHPILLQNGARRGRPVPCEAYCDRIVR